MVKREKYYKMLSGRYFTLDGEHFNERGSELLAKVLSKNIKIWIQKRDNNKL